MENKPWLDPLDYKPYCWWCEADNCYVIKGKIIREKGLIHIQVTVDCCDCFVVENHIYTVRYINFENTIYLT